MVQTTEGVIKHLTNLVEWHKMGAAGIFPPESRLELINGEILEMSPTGSNHAGHINRLNKLFSKLIPDDVITSDQEYPFSEPIFSERSMESSLTFHALN